MAHPQSSPRGLFAKERIDVGSQQLTYNSTAMIFSAGVQITGAGGLITANSTGLTTAGTVTLGGMLIGSGSAGALVLDTTAALPGNVSADGFVLVENSTGKNLAINTTGQPGYFLPERACRHNVVRQARRGLRA